MKKRVNQIIADVLIWTVTLAVGAAISTISFNLFDTLTRAQTRWLFAMDILLLLAVGAAALFIYEAKMNKAEREAEFRKRHNKRVEREEKRMRGIDKIISCSNYAA